MKGNVKVTYSTWFTAPKSSINDYNLWLGLNKDLSTKLAEKGSRAGRNAWAC